MIQEKGLTKVSVGRLCKLFGKSRQAYYRKKWCTDKQVREERIVLELVSEVRRELPMLGTRKLYLLLKEPLATHQIKMGRDKLHLFLQKEGLLISKRSVYPKTTNSKHWMKKYPNLIKELVITESEQVWVSDITYLCVGLNFNYLSLITDSYSKKIIGYHLHTHLDKSGPIAALNMALKQRSKPYSMLIHHSDRGVQYCSYKYVQLLRNSNIAISMTEQKDAYQNAIAERVNGILKHEFGLNRLFKNHNDAKLTVKSSIDLYNSKRPHMSCDYLTPNQAHLKHGELKKKWKKKKYK